MKKKIFCNILCCFVIAAAGIILTSCGEETPQKKPSAEMQTDGGFTVGPPEQIIPSPDSVLQNGTPGKIAEPAKTEKDSGFRDLRFESLEKTEEKTVQTVQVQKDHIHRMTEQDAAAATVVKQPRRTNWNIKTNQTDPGSLAAQLAEKSNDGTRLVWQPQEMPTLLSPVRLPDSALSPDSSTIAFVETTGNAEGPFGSRFVLMSTADWSVIRIIEYPGRFVEKITWIPGTVKMAALCSAQPEMDQENGLAVVDLLTGKETGFVQTPAGMGRTAFLADRQQYIILSHPKLPELVLIPADSLVIEKQKILPVESPDSIAAISPDGKRLAAVPSENGKRISIFKTADHQPLATTDIPASLSLSRIVFLGNSADFYLCGKAMQSNSALLRNGRIRHLDGWSSGFGAASADGNTVYHVQRHANKISVIDTVSGMERRLIETNRTEPRLKNPGEIKAFFVLPAIQGLAILDSQGNFYLTAVESGKGKYGERAIIFQRNDR